MQLIFKIQCIFLNSSTMHNIHMRWRESPALHLSGLLMAVAGVLACCLDLVVLHKSDHHI